MPRTVLVCLVLCCVALVPLPADASRLVPRTIEELAIGSSLVLTGTVAETSSSWNQDHNQIYTTITIDIDAVLKGEITERVFAFTQLGGAVGDTVMTIIDAPTFTQDEWVLIFAKPEPGTTDQMTIAGLGQGKFHLETDPSLGEVVARNAFEGQLTLASVAARIDALFNR